MDGIGANEITVEDIENFLNGDGAVTPAAGNKENSPDTQPSGTETGAEQTEPAQKPETETQAFAHRLKEATNKARNEERESIAKSLGYESYADMQKKREEDMLKEKGLDPEDVSPVVNKLVEQRLAEDPRMQELETIRQQRVADFAKTQLAELNELTGGIVSKMEDVPKDVIELWKTKGSLTAAYLELHGAELVRKVRTQTQSDASRGTVGHMSSPSGSPAQSSGSKRSLNDQEKRAWRQFYPDMSDEDLNKIQVDN